MSFLHKEILRPKNQIWENRFLGLNFCPDFGAQIGQQHIFIIWQDGQTPINHFSRTLAQPAPLGISRYLGPKSKKPTFYTGPNWQYRRAKLPTRFSTIGPNKGELQFGYW